MSENLQDAVKKFASDLAARLNTFLDDVSVLEVRTYTTPADQVATTVQGNQDVATILTEGKALLRAYTRVGFDGDTTVLAPTDANGDVSKAVWELHQNFVKQAMENRTRTIQTLGEAAASALKALNTANNA